MDWKTIAKDKLYNYSAKQASVANLTDEIHELEYRRRGIRSATSDGTPVAGGTNKREEMLLNTIARQEELKENLHSVSRWIKRVERGLAELTEEENTILSRFYIDPEKGAAERLAMDLGIDVKTVYWRKDRALRKFTMAMYGCVEN